MRLLVIDPDDAFGSTLSGALSRQVEVLAVPGADEAMRAVLGRAVDLLVAPLRTEFVRLMSSLNERLPSPPAFAFLCLPEQSTAVADALRDGAFACVPRPVEPDVVRVLLRRAVEQRQTREHVARAEARTRRELAEGRRLQRAMMPAAAARVGGMSVAVRTRPSAELGGDFVDYAEAGPSRAAVIIADVAGHGLSAAMLTTLVKSAFRNAATNGFAPGDVAANVGDAIRPFDDWRFVTLIAARVDRAAKTIEYVNAGHPAAWVFRRGGIVSKLDATGPLISSGVELSIESATEPLPEHAGILMYTDGITDANAPESGARFGAGRLEEALSRGRGGGESLLDAIFQSVDAFTGGQSVKDDMTALTVTIGVPGLA